MPTCMLNTCSWSVKLLNMHVFCNNLECTWVPSARDLVMVITKEMRWVCMAGWSFHDSTSNDRAHNTTFNNIASVKHRLVV